MNRAKIEDTLLAMGVPAGIKGFNYIADAIQIFGEKERIFRLQKNYIRRLQRRTTQRRQERKGQSGTLLELSEAIKEIQKLLKNTLVSQTAIIPVR